LILPVPAIDIIDGQCVRLEKGDYARVSIYDDSPLDMAFYWEKLGAPLLHLIDLDGARLGKPVNHSIISRIIKSVHIPVEVGGGIRNVSSFHAYLDSGAQRIILGSVAIRNPQLLDKCLKEAKKEVVVSVDSRGGMIAIQGWIETTEISAVELTNALKSRGVEHFIYTDIDRDGTLQGINFHQIRHFLRKTGVRMFIAGGVSTRDDIYGLKQMDDGIEGIILGKALYSGALSFAEVQKILQEEEKCSPKE